MNFSGGGVGYLIVDGSTGQSGRGVALCQMKLQKRKNEDRAVLYTRKNKYTALNCSDGATLEMVYNVALAIMVLSATWLEMGQNVLQIPEWYYGVDSYTPGRIKVFFTT